MVGGAVSGLLLALWLPAGALAGLVLLFGVLGLLLAARWVPHLLYPKVNPRPTPLWQRRP
jgi:hypothetical protein